MEQQIMTSLNLAQLNIIKDGIRNIMINYSFDLMSLDCDIQYMISLIDLYKKVEILIEDLE